MAPTERQRRDRLDAAFGEWIRQRLADQKPDRWTQQRLRDELAARGYEVKREWLNQVIGGKHAGDDLRKAIEQLLGEFPEPAEVDAVSPDLVAAIRAQTAAINDLVALIRPLVDDSAESLEVRLRALEALARRPSGSSDRGSRGQSAPRAKAG